MKHITYTGLVLAAAIVLFISYVVYQYRELEKDIEARPPIFVEDGDPELEIKKDPEPDE